jgi:maltose O-acetyltransferase
MFFYNLLSKGNISRRSTIGLGVKILNIRNLSIAENVNVNFDCILDGRGGVIVLGENVDIAPQVNIWTLQHNVLSNNHESNANDVIIEKGVWIGNRAIILPGSILARDSVIGAGVSYKSENAIGEITVSAKFRVIQNKKRSLDDDFVLPSLRRFR